MICEAPKPVYGNPFFRGLNVVPYPDGYSIYTQWAQAIQSSYQHELGYNVYFSTNKDTVLSEGPKYFTRQLELTIRRFTPGDLIYVLIRAMEYDPLVLAPLSYPTSAQALNAYSYPESALSSNILEDTLLIPLIDASEFPPYGIIKVGTELMRYTNIDYVTNTLTIPIDGRGYYATNVRYHNIDGYDGYVYQNPTVFSFAGWEDLNLIYGEVQPRFEPPEFAFTVADGYKQVVKDILTTDLSGSDENMTNFPAYDYGGYHRTSLLDYFSGKCIGSYAGGEQGCDGYKVRGFNLQDRSTQQLEMMLDATGEPMVLLRRKWTGIRCNCFRSNQEHHEGRCPYCLGTGFVGAYDQYYNPRRPDGRILVRFPPTVDDLTLKPVGLEQNFAPNNAWTLVVPAIKDRDVLIRFDENNAEEWRLEVVNVTRNRLLFSQSGSQIMQLYRLDKTDPIYQWRAIRDTSMFPEKLNTSLGVLRNYGPHLHVVTINENITSLTQINSTTSTVGGHSHAIINGIVQDMLQHSHQIIL